MLLVKVALSPFLLVSADHLSLHPISYFGADKLDVTDTSWSDLLKVHNKLHIAKY